MWLNSLRDLTMLVFGLLKRFWNQFTKKTVLKYWLISFMWPKNVMNITIYILNMPSFLPYKVLHFLGKTSVLIINFYQKRYQCKKYLCETNVGQFLRFGSYNFLCLDSKFLNQWIDFNDDLTKIMIISTYLAILQNSCFLSFCTQFFSSNQNVHCSHLKSFLFLNCIENNNLHSEYTIVSALESAPLFR